MRALALLLVLLSGCALAPRSVEVQHEAGVTVTCDHPARWRELEPTRGELVFDGFPASGVTITSGKRSAFVRCEDDAAVLVRDLALEVLVPPLGIPLAIHDVVTEKLHRPAPDHVDLRSIEARVFLDDGGSRSATFFGPLEGLPKPDDGCDFVMPDGAHGKWIDKERGTYSLDAVGRFPNPWKSETLK